MFDQQETINAIALTRLNQFSLAGLASLYRITGSATAVIDHRDHIRDILPDASQRLIDALSNLSEPLQRAEDEYRYDESHDIEALTMNDSRYPQRLKDCDDAPIVLFYKGTADLNARRVVSIVGTRQCTPYGHDLIQRFCRDLKQWCPEVLIVSGLAYGVDINVHRQALANGYETAAVLAHGHDTLYPPRHKDTADAMIRHGALVTEFLTHTKADKVNFVRRNRIVAGMADATILVESATHGGGLITTAIAQSYGRDVFAFPGAVGAPYSEGCNALIRNNGASLITSAGDFADAMGWKDDLSLEKARQKGVERDLFPTLTDDEQRLVALLQRSNDMPLNMLAIQADMPIATATTLLFSLEMKGVVRLYAGNTYHLIT